MNKGRNDTPRDARPAPLDHLPPGGRSQEDEAAGQPEWRPTGSNWKGVQDAEAAQPAEPAAEGGADAEASRGKATGSPAAVSTRRHLEGSEQGPV